MKKTYYLTTTILSVLLLIFAQTHAFTNCSLNYLLFVNPEKENSWFGYNMGTKIDDNDCDGEDEVKF